MGDTLDVLRRGGRLNGGTLEALLESDETLFDLVLSAQLARREDRRRDLIRRAREAARTSRDLWSRLARGG